jgi:hypothetical protein
MFRSVKGLSLIASLMYIIAGVVVIYVALAGIVIRESLNFIVYGSAVAAIGVAHIPIMLRPYILHPFGRRGYLWALTLIAALLGFSSLIIMNPYSVTGLAVAPGAVTSVYLGLLARKARDPGTGDPN